LLSAAAAAAAATSKMDLMPTKREPSTSGVGMPVSSSGGDPGHSDNESNLSRVLFVYGSLLGREVEVTLRDGSRYKGTLYAAVPEEGVVLRFAERVRMHGLSWHEQLPKPAVPPVPFMVFRRSDLVRLYAKGVPLASGDNAEAAPRPSVETGTRSGSVVTDREISHGAERESPSERELVAWADDQAAPDASATKRKAEGAHRNAPHRELAFDALDRYQRTKWDQFVENERKFGVKTTYTEEHYTTKLDPNRFSEADIARAARLAAEIESKAADNPHVAEERGQFIQMGDESGCDDEELRYGAVVRTAEHPGESNEPRTSEEIGPRPTGIPASEDTSSSATDAPMRPAASKATAAGISIAASTEYLYALRRNRSSASLSRNSSSEYLLDQYDVEHKRVLQRLSSRQRLEDARMTGVVVAQSGSTSPAMGNGSDRASPALATTPTAPSAGPTPASVTVGREVAGLNLELSVPHVPDEVIQKLNEFKAQQQQQQGYESERSRERETEYFRRFSADIERKTSSGNLRSMIRAGSKLSLAGSESSLAVEATSDERERSLIQSPKEQAKSEFSGGSATSGKAMDPNAKDFHLNVNAEEFVPSQALIEPAPQEQQRFQNVSSGNPHRGRGGRSRYRGMSIAQREQVFLIQGGGGYFYGPGMGAAHPAAQPYPSAYFLPYAPQPLMGPAGYSAMPMQPIPAYPPLPHLLMPPYPQPFTSPTDFMGVPPGVANAEPIMGSRHTHSVRAEHGTHYTSPAGGVAPVASPLKSPGQEQAPTRP
jgi:hypothetical protein